MKQLVVSLKDIQGVPHGSQFSRTNVRVIARYTSEIVLTDGTIVPNVVVDEPVSAPGGSVTFDVWASDDPAVKAEYRDFAIRVDVQVSPSRGTSRKGGYTKTAKVLMSSPSPVQFGSLPSAEGLPPKWTSVADFRDEFQALVVEGQALVAQNADTLAAAQQAEANSAANLVLAQQAQAAKLEIPDANTAAMIGNPSTATHAELAKIVPTESVLSFGAIGDTVADDYAAIVATMAAAEVGATVLFPPAVGYRVTSPVVVPFGVNVDMQAPLVYAGPDGQTALTVGPAASPGQHRAKHTIRVRRASTADWTNEADRGVWLRNHSYGSIHIAQVTGFTVGVRVSGEGSAAMSYNEITLGELRNNRIGIDITQATNGWANENNFYGGSFAISSTYNVDMSRTCVRITSDDLSYINQNNNVFHKPSFEPRGSTHPDPEHGLCVDVVHGNQNTFLHARHESASRVALVSRNASQNNVFTTGFNMEGASRPTYSDKGTLPSSVFRLASQAAAEASTFPVRAVTDAHKRACYYDGSSSVNIPGVTIQSSTVGDSTALGLITLAPNYVEMPSNRGLGFYVSTRSAKRFTVLADSDLGYGGRIFVRAHAADGSVLGAVGSARVTHIGAYGSIFGGAYRSGSDNDGPRFFTVAADVDYIFVGVAGGSNPVRLRGFAITTPDPGFAATWLALPHNEDVGVAVAPPTSGTWARGRRLHHAEPTPGQPQGWVCTTAGTPGTWTAMPSL